MTLFLLFLLTTTFILPKPNLTPGLARPLSLNQICTIKWGKDARHVTPEMKQDVCLAYGITVNCDGKHYEIDHLISREIGGADDEHNLWPEQLADAHIKDVVENWTHKQVCSGKMSLKNAQNQMAEDWTVLYKEYEKSK